MIHEFSDMGMWWTSANLELNKNNFCIISRITGAYKLAPAISDWSVLLISSINNKK
jgi:hypothetical protein